MTRKRVALSPPHDAVPWILGLIRRISDPSDRVFCLARLVGQHAHTLPMAAAFKTELRDTLFRFYHNTFWPDHRAENARIHLIVWNTLPPDSDLRPVLLNQAWEECQLMVTLHQMQNPHWGVFLTNPHWQVVFRLLSAAAAGNRQDIWNWAAERIRISVDAWQAHPNGPLHALETGAEILEIRDDFPSHVRLQHYFSGFLLPMLDRYLTLELVPQNREDVRVLSHLCEISLRIIRLYPDHPDTGRRWDRLMTQAEISQDPDLQLQVMSAWAQSHPSSLAERIAHETPEWLSLPIALETVASTTPCPDNIFALLDRHPLEVEDRFKILSAIAQHHPPFAQVARARLLPLWQSAQTESSGTVRAMLALKAQLDSDQIRERFERLRDFDLPALVASDSDAERTEVLDMVNIYCQLDPLHAQALIHQLVSAPDLHAGALFIWLRHMVETNPALALDKLRVWAPAIKASDIDALVRRASHEILVQTRGPIQYLNASQTMPSRLLTPGVCQMVVQAHESFSVPLTADIVLQIARPMLG